MAKKNIKPAAPTPAFPYVEIEPDPVLLTTLIQEVRKIETGVVSAPAWEDKLIPRFSKYLQEGTDAEVMACLRVSIYHAFLRGLHDPDVHKLVAARAIRHSREINGQWSNLLDELGHISFYAKASKKITLKRWGEWAATIKNPATFVKDVSKALNFKGRENLPLVAIAAQAPFFTQEMASQIIVGRAHAKFARVLLDRTDLDPSTMRLITKKGVRQLARLGDTQGYMLQDLRALEHIVARPQWHDQELEDQVLKEVSRIYDLIEKGKMKPDKPGRILWADFLSKWKSSDPKFWGKVVTLFKGDPTLVVRVMSNPGFPLALANKYLSEHGGTEVRVALAQNPVLRQDPKMRETLKNSGQNMQVWCSLLESSTDPKEASQLFCYIATKDPDKAGWYFLGEKLPKGTEVPSTIVARIMVNQKYHEHRVQMIKALPGLKPTGEAAPTLPKRARRQGRTK